MMKTTIKFILTILAIGAIVLAICLLVTPGNEGIYCVIGILFITLISIPMVLNLKKDEKK